LLALLDSDHLKGLALPCRVEALTIVTFQHDHLWLLEFFDFNIKDLVDKLFLNLFLIPSVSLPAQLFLHQSLKEFVKDTFSGLLHAAHLYQAHELCQEYIVAWDNINCAVEWLRIIQVLLNDVTIERLIEQLRAGIGNDGLAGVRQHLND